jgi:hypothetical protein
MDSVEHTVRTIALAALVAVGQSGVADAKGPRPHQVIGKEPIYQSLEDPPGEQPTRILVQDGGVFTFGGGTSDRHSLAKSDLGFPVYFVRVKGGVRISEKPFVFPDGPLSRFDFEDYSCSISVTTVGKDVLCRDKRSGQIYHSRLVAGGLVSFDMRCFREFDRVCHYQLIEGRALRPNKIQTR